MKQMIYFVALGFILSACDQAKLPSPVVKKPDGATTTQAPAATEGAASKPSQKAGRQAEVPLDTFFPIDKTMPDKDRTVFATSTLEVCTKRLLDVGASKEIKWAKAVIDFTQEPVYAKGSNTKIPEEEAKAKNLRMPNGKFECVKDLAVTAKDQDKGLKISCTINDKTFGLAFDLVGSHKKYCILALDPAASENCKIADDRKPCKSLYMALPDLKAADAEKKTPATSDSMLLFEFETANNTVIEQLGHLLLTAALPAPPPAAPAPAAPVQPAPAAPPEEPKK